MFVPAVSKTLAIKPANLQCEPRELSSLSHDEMESLVLSSKVVDSKELGDLYRSKAEDGEMVTERLRTIIRERISNCPNKIAHMLVKASVDKDEWSANMKHAETTGDSYIKKGLSPTEYLKDRYKKAAKQDMEEEAKLSCNACGKSNAKPAKCGGCLSGGYAESEVMQR